MSVTDLGSQLDRDEGIFLKPYDDATGLVIGPGTTIKGNITIGTGRNLSGDGISDLERLLLRSNDIAQATMNVSHFLPWTAGLDPVRRSVLQNLSFNLGIHGLLEFKAMLSALQGGDLLTAADQLLNSEAAKEEPTRITRLSVQLKTGIWQ